MYLLLSDRFTVALLQRLSGMINWKYKTNFTERFSKKMRTVEFKEITKVETTQKYNEKIHNYLCKGKTNKNRRI